VAYAGRQTKLLLSLHIENKEKKNGYTSIFIDRSNMLLRFGMANRDKVKEEKRNDVLSISWL
jgi:hypothetical protein